MHFSDRQKRCNARGCEKRHEMVRDSVDNDGRLRLLLWPCLLVPQTSWLKLAVAGFFWYYAGFFLLLGGGSVERPKEIQTRPAGRRTKGRFSTSRAGMAPSSKVLVTPRLP